MSRTDIVINKADKGSTTVVIDRSDYIRDALDYLADQSVCQQLASDTTGDIKQMISNKLDKLMRSGILDKEMHTYCEPPVTLTAILSKNDPQEPHENQADCLKLQ